MAGRRKKRKTQKGLPDTSKLTGKPIPKSFVIRSGSVKSPSLQELVLNMRKMFEPNTAVRLKERRSNKLKDYASVAGPMGVSHFAIVGQTLLHATLRLARFPRGPTLYFNILEYTLMRDIANASFRPKSQGSEYQSAPLVILNGFSKEEEDEEGGGAIGEEKECMQPSRRETKLTATFIQNMFAPIILSRMNMTSARRIVLFHHEHGQVYVRHYTIHVQPKDATISKPIRNIVRASSTLTSASQTSGHYSAAARMKASKKILKDLAQMTDLADFVLDHPVNAPDSDAEDVHFAESASVTSNAMSHATMDEAEEEDDVKEKKGNATIEMTPGGGKSKQKAISVVEVGPRLTLELFKIQNGFCDGKPMYSKYRSGDPSSNRHHHRNEMSDDPAYEEMEHTLETGGDDLDGDDRWGEEDMDSDADHDEEDDQGQDNTSQTSLTDDDPSDETDHDED